MPDFNPTLDECNEAIDWMEEWIESNAPRFADPAAKLKIRLRSTDDEPAELYIALIWYGHEPPENSYVIPPPNLYMYQWCRDDENGISVWKNAINKSR